MSALKTTSYALLGQLALRPWSTYDLAKNIGRTLHWFWPQAESAIYAEIKRLAGLGLAKGRSSPGKRGRPQTTYTITSAGQRELAAWLGTPPDSFAFHFEALLRVHLAPWGTRDDLLRALDAAKADAEILLRQATVIGTEFVERRHQFQDQVHVRAILFDYLWSFGLTMYAWAERSHERVAAWDDLAGRPALAREATKLIERSLAQSPLTS